MIVTVSFGDEFIDKWDFLEWYFFNKTTIQRPILMLDLLVFQNKFQPSAFVYHPGLGDNSDRETHSVFTRPLFLS